MGLSDLVKDQRQWSQETFGTRNERGPIGPLKHLVKEANEVIKAVESHADHEEVLEELADCLIVLLDAIWRAGFSYYDVVHAAESKMEKNRARKWPKPSGDEPVEHIR